MQSTPSNCLVNVSGKCLREKDFQVAYLFYLRIREGFSVERDEYMAGIKANSRTVLGAIVAPTRVCFQN